MVLQGRWEVVNAHKRAVWVILRESEFHRFYEDDQTCDVFPTFATPSKLYSLELTPPSRNLARGGRVYGESDPVLEITPVQREGWHIKSSRWA